MAKLTKKSPRIDVDIYNESCAFFISNAKLRDCYALLTSKDLEHWTDDGVVFHTDKLDQELNREAITAQMADVVADPRLAETAFYAQGNYNVDIYNTAVFRYESYYLAMPAIHPSRTIDLADPSDNIAFKVTQLMCSRDLRTWTRLGDRHDFIGLSPPGSGAYDICVAFPPSSAVVRGDELWFYYCGVTDAGWPPKTGSKASRKDWKYYRPDKGAICLAVLRRDGFISLDASEKEGTVLTKPFKVTGSKLFVNVDAQNGELRVEALRKDGEALAACAPVKGNFPCAEVKWQKGNIAGLKEKVVALRFTLRNARFYSFWLQ